MNPRHGVGRIRPAWWTVILAVVTVGFVALCSVLYTRAFTPYVRVTLTSDRAGLMMDPGGKVKMRGVDVGRVSSIISGRQPVSLQLEIDPAQIRYIPANVQADIKATTVFGTKYVDLIYPDNPSLKPLSAGQILVSRNVPTEVNTVFENLVDLLDQIDPAKLNAVLTALAEGLRGHGEMIGGAIADTNEVLRALNPRSETVRQDWHSLAAVSDTYSTAAQHILAVLDGASTTSATITSHTTDVDSLLVNLIGLGRSGTQVIGANNDNLIHAINILEPTTNLLMKYNPEYTCTLIGTKWYYDNVAYQAAGGNGRTVVIDASLLFGSDPYVYPDNLPIVAAKGGPGGKPGCGSLPDVSKNYPVRTLVTNTGWGTGMDIRPNVGLGHPCWVDFLPVTRAVPEPASLRCQGSPSPGLPIPASGPLPPSAPPPPR
ncbi:MCE family protein [Mycobacterium seoulense]|uniref:MCE family protein n=1 Tax=Mycobacterium seoulense TaxID=386911 RepID=UPI003CF3E503